MKKITQYKKYPKSAIVRFLIIAATLITTIVSVSIIIYISVKGIANLDLSLFEKEFSTDNLSMLPSIINTFYITALTLIIAVPVGVFSAVFLAEYADRNSLFVKLVRITNETLAGIPSIIYGLFGFLAFVVARSWGYSLIAGVITLAVMVLPLIIRTSEEAITAVSDSYREGSYGLGAGKLRTIFKIIIPSAMPGIISGIILAIGRIVGETAALVYTAGTVPDAATKLTSSARTLSVHLYCLLNEGLYTEQAYATAFVLLAIALVINAAANFLAEKARKGVQQ